MLTKISKSSSLNAGPNPATTRNQDVRQLNSHASFAHGIDPDLAGNPPEISYGVITSGACAGEQAQADFDAHVAGHPPQAADGP